MAKEHPLSELPSIVENPLTVSTMVAIYDLGYHVQSRKTDDGVDVITYFVDPPKIDGSSQSPWPAIKVTKSGLKIPAGSLEIIQEKLLSMLLSR